MTSKEPRFRYLGSPGPCARRPEREVPLIAVAAARGLATLGGKAVRAVDGAVRSGLERHLGILTTGAADRGKHLALGALIDATGVAAAVAVANPRLAAGSTFRTAARLVSEALL